MKQLIRDKFKDLTDVKSLPPNIRKLIENLAKDKSQNSKQPNASSKFTKSQRGYRGVVQPQSIENQNGLKHSEVPIEDSSDTEVPGSADGNGGQSIPPIGEGEDSGKALIMIELSQIWFNIRSKLQTYVHMFWNKVSCPLLKQALGIIYNFGIQDLDVGLQEIFKMLFGNKQTSFVYAACNY